MKKSTIAIFEEAGTPFALENVNIPMLQEEEILVKNEYTTLCRSDLYTYCGKRKEKTPTILGHEIVGRIAAFGKNAPRVDERGKTLQIGDRVSWAIYASDPNSPLAKAGIPQKSADLFKYGHERVSRESNLHGGLSQYTILRKNTPIVKIDEQVKLKVAAIINCAVSTVAGSIRLAGNLEGKKVLVNGAGMLGIVACAMSKTLGAAQVTVADVNPKRLEAAKNFGTSFGILAEDNLQQSVHQKFGVDAPFDVVLEYSGVTSALEQTLQLLAIGGTVVWVGSTYPQPDLAINAEQIVRKLITIKGLHNYNAADFIMAVDFIEQQHTNFPFESMVHDGFSLDEVNEAFEYGMTENPFRVGIKIN